MNTLVVLALGGPASLVAILWLGAITHDRTAPMPDLPDDLGVTPATHLSPAILWARHGNTVRFYAAPGTQLPNGREAQWNTNLPTEEPS